MPAPLDRLPEKERILAACRLFDAVVPADRRRFAAAATVRRFDPGAMLFQQDEPAAGFHIIHAGRVKVFLVNLDGREQVLHLFGPGDLCGEVPVFFGGRYPAGAVAEMATTTLFLARADFLHIGERHPRVLVAMLAVLSQRLRMFVNLVDDLALKEVSARLAKHLMDLRVRRPAPEVTLETSKAVLAARLGTIAATLSRTLARMQRRKIIAVHGRRIRLLDLDALAELAAGIKL